MQTKSPFYVVEHFISPLMCEDMIDTIDFNVPNVDKNDKPVKTVKSCEAAERIVYQRLKMILPELQAHYQFLYRGTEPVLFEWFTEGTSGKHQSENSEFVKQKWVRTRGRDLSAVLFLSDYSDEVPFEQEFEVYGGKLEFAQHKFGFNPQRGTLVVFPSDPHFINNTSPVFAGDLYQARIHIAAQSPYMYQPQNFPGDYTKWFAAKV